MGEAEPRSGFLDSGDVRLHYADWGGPPQEEGLLLLHGLSANARVWDEFALEARQRFRVVALDQRGHGDSGWSPAADYTTFEFAADLARLLDRLGWEQAAIVGSSMGGRNGLALAATMPERVSSLVMADIGPGRLPGAPPPPPALPDPNREESPQSFASLDEAAAWMHGVYPTRSLELCRRRVFHNTRPGPGGRLVWKWDPKLYLGWRSSDDLWPLLANVTCAVLLLRGARSEVLSPELAEATRRALRDCRLVEIPGVGHNIYTDRPDAFREAVAPFLGLT